MWDPQYLTTLQASTARYGDSFTFLHFAYKPIWSLTAAPFKGMVQQIKVP
jgi:hypothetical protein